MPLITNTNSSSLNTNNQLNKISKRLADTLEKLSTGKKINKASDNAAGLAIATRLSNAIQGNDVAIRNSSDGISLLQVADGAAGGISSSLQRMRELSIQAGNGALNPNDRQALQSEFNQLQDEVKRVISNTEFNGNSLLNSQGSIDFQVGSESADSVSINTPDLQSQLTDNGFFEADISTASGAQSALDALSTSIESVSSARSEFGAVANRLESTISGLSQRSVDLQASRSRIEDTDFARQTSELTRNLILQQAGIAAQAQSNISSQLVLGLLKS